MNPRNLGEALLIGLKQLGVDHFFANPGTEFVSVIRGFQELPQETVPNPVLAPHEFQAVSMAYGSYLATGKPQAVMTHAATGAANALIGLIGASRMNVPLIFISGATAKTEHGPGCRDKLIHWAQDSKDQAAMYREYMKWEVELTDPTRIAEVLDKAYEMAMAEPRGPVAIQIPRDVLVSEKVFALNAGPSQITPHEKDAEGMEQAGIWLREAKKPLVITNRLGADSSAVSILSEIAESQGLGVVTPEDFYLSLPADHPNHLGYRHGEALKETDFVLVLDTEAPWYPLENGPSSDAKVIHVGSDPKFSRIPLRSHRGDLFLTMSPKMFLQELTKFAPNEKRLHARKEWIKSKKLKKENMGDVLNAASISATLSEYLDENTVLINELSLVPEQLNVRHAGTYFRSGSASPLGWGVGCALGIKLSDPKKTVIAGIGDGVFYLSPMLGVLSSSAQLEAPFITIVLNNGGMASIAKTVADFYPDTKKNPPLTEFGTGEIEKCANFVSGLGIRATSIAELREALKNAIRFCREKKRPAVINAVFNG